MSRKIRKPHRYKKNKPIYKYKAFWFTILFILIFSLIIYFLFFSHFFDVKKINIKNLNMTEPVELKEIKEEEVKEFIREKTFNKFLFYSLNNIFLINSKNIKKQALESFPQIDEIIISRSFPDKLNILIKERAGFACFCFIDQSEQNCFVLDEKGIVFKEKKEEQGLIEIIDKRRDNLPYLGEKIIEEDELNKLLEINLELENNSNIKIKKILIFIEKLTIETEKDWQIYFNLDQDIKWQLTKLKVLLEEKISEEQRENLEYIELRFGNFANPKYKEIQK